MASIIAFEGMPGSGKTTAINNILKKDLLHNCAVIPELYIGKLNDSSGSRNYLDLEVAKSEKIQKMHDYYDNILLDRTFLSTLAYYYAKSKTDKNPDLYLDSIGYFESLDKKYAIFRPTKLFYLNTSIDESIKRREKFSKLYEFDDWFNPEFLNYFSEFYSKNISNFNMPKCTVINTINQPKGDFLKKVESILKEI